MVLRFVVEASSVDEATERAAQYFDERLHYENGGPFDYMKLMTGDSKVSGSSRWTKYEDEPLAFEVNTRRGWEEVFDAWNETKNSYQNAFNRVGEALEKHPSVEERMESTTIRAYGSDIGYGPNTICYLYWPDRYSDFSGGVVNTPNIFSDLKVKTHSDGWYVVPVDAHY